MKATTDKYSFFGRRWRIFVYAALFASCSALGLYALSRQWQALLLPQRPFDVQQYATTLRAEVGFQGHITRDEKGVLTLSGWCNDTARLTPLLEKLQKVGIAYRNQIVCTDELRRSVVWILHRSGYSDARVASGTTLDSVVITTNLNIEDERWPSVSRQLSQLPGLRAWRVNIASSGEKRMRADTMPVAKVSPSQETSASSKASVGLLSMLFRSAGQISAWMGFPDQAGYWSIKALELGAHGISEDYIAAVSQQYQIPLHLARAVIWIESRGRHTNRDGSILTSSKGALGIMQLMPNTARELKVNPFDVRDNIRGGFAYLAQLARKYQGDWDKVVAAYNWGPRNIDEAVTRHGKNWRHALPRVSANYLLQVRQAQQSI